MKQQVAAKRCPCNHQSITLARQKVYKGFQFNAREESNRIATLERLQSEKRPRVEMRAGLAHLKLLPPLLKCLEELPLHERTLDLIRDLLNSKPSKEQLFSLAKLVSGYEKSTGNSDAGRRHLESLIYQVHFIWSSQVPRHLQLFRKHYTEMVAYWPYEQHRAILSMPRPKASSLRYRWDDNSSVVLSMMRYIRHPWSEYEPNGQALSPLQRDLLFNTIFTHYSFLKQNPRLCKNGRKLPIPIVEIPMRPLGNDIAAVRIKNLFKRKVSSVYKILAIDNPTLSSENEALLCDIIQNTQTRKQARLYQAAYRRAYIIEDNPDEHEEDSLIPKFAASSLLLKNI